MPILNYTTKVPVSKTVADIQKLLAKAGAASVQVNYAAGEPTSISFLLLLGGRPVPFRLPNDWAGVRQALSMDPAVQYRMKTDEHAKRVSWRIVKDWCEAQMAMIESRQASMAQLFLPHAVQANGQTFFEEVAGRPGMFLPAGDENGG